jgi:hypothetical protein
MSPSELRRFMESEEGKRAGLTRSQARAQGIKSGRESARAILRMKERGKANWTKTDWQWARRQVAFIRRMRGAKGSLRKDGKPTRKLMALKIWGHDPEKRMRSNDVLPGGLAEQVPEHLFDRSQLAMGIEVELEHTDDPAIAEEIAKDHLAEQILAGVPQDYYTRLKQMEEGMHASHANAGGRPETYLPIEYVPIGEAYENAEVLGLSLERLIKVSKRTEARWRKKGMRPRKPDTRWMKRAGVDSVEVVGGTLMADGTLLRRNGEAMQTNPVDPAGPGESFFDEEWRKAYEEAREAGESDRAAREYADEETARLMTVEKARWDLPPYETAYFYENKQWTRKYVNELPDSAFLWVGPGGKQDEQGRTHPLTLRSLPYKNKQGKVDLPHLRNAIARLTVTRDIPEVAKPKIKKRACKLLEQHGGQCSTYAYGGGRYAANASTNRNLALPPHIGLELTEFKQGPETPTYALLAAALDYEPVSEAMVSESADELQELNLRLNNPRLDRLVTEMRAFAASPPSEYVMAKPVVPNATTELDVPDWNMMRDVSLEAEQGKVFRLRMWDTNRRDRRGQTIMGYRFEQVEPEAQAMVLFEGEDFAGSPMHADDDDKTVRALIGFLTLRPGDTDEEYFASYTPDQMDFAQSDAEALQLYTEEDMPLEEWDEE